MNKQNSTTSIVLVGLFAALTVLGTMIKIPMPTGAFAHLGNSVLLLAVLLIGYKKGALAGGLGFAIFDVLNGFAAEAPYFILESFIVGGAAALMIFFFHQNIDTIWKLIIVASVTGIAKIIMTQLKNTIMGLLAGADFNVAFASALSKLPATFINVVTTIVIVTLAYFPLKKAMTVIFSRQSF
ncbi:ECF transporter S component [Candidatus Enterococcus ikei]|uniref:ECF transporter S component n=1 Tax=Candidatus Enterococcus ikei TaxID=2815326 RepID=A0ABS3H3X4_9ENTE|nr:ECF transporter S component [Enterococcus sp. DIV0869a]MBO0441914.1 ECF transporter S component [Enterococcus sp. DIV0869a]